MKKILAFVLAMAMVLGMTLTTFAEEGESETGGTTGETTGETTQVVEMPKASNTAEAKVTNVETGAQVTAYHIVEAIYGEGGEGFTGYQVVNGEEVTISISDPINPTPEEVGAIAANANLLAKLVQKTMIEDESNKGTYTADLNAGYWLVLIKGAADTVYNPMLVGVYYSVSGTEDTMDSAPLNVTEGWKLVTSPAYAKSTKPEVEKEITDSKKDAAIGSDVSFKITTTIPSYGPEYTNPVVKITDTLSGGLSFNNDIRVKVGEAEIGNENYTVDSTTINGFVLIFNSAYVKGAGNGKEVVVEYTAKLTQNAGVNFDPNTNTAYMEYTNDPSSSELAKTDEKKTYTYTFGIDAELYGDSTETWNKVTEEILKTGEKREVEREEGKKVETTRLSGATFALLKVEKTVVNETEVTNEVQIATADSDIMGRLSFKGLETGTYKLKETKAPDGYTLSTESLTVVIAADYNADGTLKEYSITIDGKESKYTAEYTNGVVTKITTDSTQSIEGDTETTNVSKTTGFVNTKISSLPSTGGIGTTIFTVGGCLIMIIAAALFFASRRKSAK